MKEIDEQIKKLEEQLANAQKELEKLKKIREEEKVEKPKIFDGFKDLYTEELEVFKKINAKVMKINGNARFEPRRVGDYKANGFYLGYSADCQWKIIKDEDGDFILVLK